MTIPMTTAAVALQGFQQGARAYQCPFGHGAMTVSPDPLANNGCYLVCQGCGHRLAVSDALAQAALAHAPAVPGAQSTILLFDGSAPRGLLPDGAVRTTGWLQVARRPISSGLWAVLVGFFLGIGMSSGNAAVPLITAVAGYGLWKLDTMKLRPASKAVNTDRVVVQAVVPGELIRLYGTAGPVGQVTAIGTDSEGRIRLQLNGGQEVLRPGGHLLWRVDLRN